MKHSPFISPACKGNPMKFTNEVLLLSLFPLFLLGCSPRGTTENKIILQDCNHFNYSTKDCQIIDKLDGQCFCQNYKNFYES